MFCLALASLFVLVVGPRHPVLAQAADRPGRVVGRIVSLSGRASVRRHGRTKEITGTPNLILYKGDTLRLARRAQMKVFCRDELRLYPLTAGEHEVPCGSRTTTQATTDYNGTDVFVMRLPRQASYPQIVSPRMTKVLGPRLVFRWTPLPGAAYRVLLSGMNGGVIWRADVKGSTEVIYPDDAPPLTTGEIYKLIVFSDGHSSEEEGLPGLTFQVLGTEEAQAIRSKEAAINNLPLTAEQKRLLTADAYRDSGLKAEAIEQLEELARKTGDASVMRLLGDMYLEVRSPDLAEARYLSAVALAEKNSDLEEQAYSQHALGVIYQIAGNTAEALKRFKNAEHLYRQLGDAESLGRLRSREKALMKRR